MTTREWHETRGNVTALGYWLKTTKLYDADELQSYYETPWSWRHEWVEYQKSMKTKETP